MSSQWLSKFQVNNHISSHVLHQRRFHRTSFLVDCGAGIGRVAKHLLLPSFDKVDLVEQNGEFLGAAPKFLVCCEERENMS